MYTLLLLFLSISVSIIQAQKEFNWNWHTNSYNTIDKRDLSPYVDTQSIVPNLKQSKLLSIPSFPYQANWDLHGKWLGADTAYSIVHPDDKNITIWTFQDTLIGLEMDKDRTTSAWIGSSIGISSNSPWNITYYWSNFNFDLRPFFNDQEMNYPSNKLWPMQPFFFKNVLYIPQIWTEKTDGDTSWIVHGTKISSIKNWRDDPLNWEIDYKMVVQGGRGVGSAVYWDNSSEVLYMWGPTTNNTHCLSRIRGIDLLVAPIDHIEMLTSDGWVKGYNNATCYDATWPFDASSGFTVRYSDSLQRYIALFSHSSYPYPSTYVSVATAQNITGPWSNSIDVFTYPEIAKYKAPCYGAFEQPFYNNKPNTSVLFAYTCNGPNGDVEKLYTTMDVYSPQAYQIDNIPWPTTVPLGAKQVDPAKISPPLPASNVNEDGTEKSFLQRNYIWLVIAIAAVIIILILSLVVFICMRRRRESNKKKKLVISNPQVKDYNFFELR